MLMHHRARARRRATVSLVAFLVAPILLGVLPVLTETPFTVAPAHSAEDAAVTNVQIVTINDLHGRIEYEPAAGEAGAAVLAGAVETLKTQNPHTLFVSAGDNIGASTFTSFIAQDSPTIDALVASGLDASAVGNHEFDQGFHDLVNRVLPRFGGGEFGLGANVYHAGTVTPALQEHHIKTVNGVRVGFIGTVTPDTGIMVRPSGISMIEFGDQLEAANRVAEEIAEETDVIVLLTHSGAGTSSCDALLEQGDDFTRLIGEASAEIDAIVSAHTHLEYSCMVPGPIGERPVIQTGHYGKKLGNINIAIDTVSKEIVSIAPSLISLLDNEGEPSFAPSPLLDDLVQDAVDAADVIGSEPVGAITADILRAGTPPGIDRSSESSLGNLIADIFVWATSGEEYAGRPAQIGLMNPGGMRADLTYGDDGMQTVRDVANVQPFANTLVTVDLTGEQLKQMLEEQWQPLASGTGTHKRHLGISQGFTYQYDEAAPRGSKIVSMQYHGAQIDPADVFTVVMNSFLATGGDGFTTFLTGTNITDTGESDLEVTVNYFKAWAEQGTPVEPAPLGRAAPAPRSDLEPVPVPPLQPDGVGEPSDTGDSSEHPSELAVTGATAPTVLVLAGSFFLIVGLVLVAPLRWRRVRGRAQAGLSSSSAPARVDLTASTCCCPGRSGSPRS